MFGREKDIELAISNDTSPEMLASLVQHGSAELQMLVAENLVTPVELLVLLSESRDVGVLSGVACNPKCPREVLDKIVLLHDPYIRQAIALYRGTPPEILERFWNCHLAGIPYIRDMPWWLARNPSTPENLVDKLYRWGPRYDVSFQELLEGHPNAPSWMRVAAQMENL